LAPPWQEAARVIRRLLDVDGRICMSNNATRALRHRRQPAQLDIL
jgi:hypothetical protein